MHSERGTSEFQHEVERELSIEPTEVLLSTTTCAAWLTASGWLKVFWPSVIDGDVTRMPEEHLPELGTEELSGNRNPATRSGAVGEGGDHEKRRFFGAGGHEPSRNDKGKNSAEKHFRPNSESTPETSTACSWSDVAVEFNMPLVLVGDASLRAYRNGIGLVVRHLCPSTRHTWLGPWDESTAQSLLATLRARLALPRTLGALLSPTETELVEDPRRYHGELISVEGRWRRAHDEAPDFIAGSSLVFPPGLPQPDRARRLRVEGLWMMTDRPGVAICGPNRELHARTVEGIAWGPGLPSTHPRVNGLPLPEDLIALIDRGRWAPGTVNGTRLLNATGWARELDTFLCVADIEAEMRRVRRTDPQQRERLGFAKDAAHCLDEERTLILAKNPDGRMIALDYRADPPPVMFSEDASGVLRWRRLAGGLRILRIGLLRDRPSSMTARRPRRRSQRPGNPQAARNHSRPRSRGSSRPPRMRDERACARTKP